MTKRARRDFSLLRGSKLGYNSQTRTIRKGFHLRERQRQRQRQRDKKTESSDEVESARRAIRRATCCHLTCVISFCGGGFNTKVDQLRTSLAGALDAAAATQQEVAGEDAGRAPQRRRSMVQGLNGLERYCGGGDCVAGTAMLVLLLPLLLFSFRVNPSICLSTKHCSCSHWS